MSPRPAAAPVFDPAALRGEYPALAARLGGKAMVYLDSACTALKSRRVAARLSELTLEWGGCGGKRSAHLMSQQVEAFMNDARASLAAFIGAESANELVFTSGTTEAVNLVARAFPFEEPRTEVVLSELEHNSVVLPFFEAERRGQVRLRWCPAPRGRLDLEALEGLVGDKTALVAVTHSSNVLGGVLPVDEACRIAHRRGACVLVDDAQYLSSHREDVAALNADFAAFSAHKLGGPFGVGALYGKEHLLNRLGTYKVGGGTVKSVSWRGEGLEVRYLDAPMKLEPGVPNPPAIAAFAEAARSLVELPEAELRAHLAGLVRRAVAGLSRFPELKLLGEPELLEQGSIVAFAPEHPGFSLADFNLFLNHELDGHFIAIRVGDHCAHVLHERARLAGSARLSFFAYNTPEEVDLFLAALEAYLREACR